MSIEDNRPAWVKTAVEIWTEDDAGTPDRERTNDAWRRLFGGDPPARKDNVEYYDGHDHFMYLHADGRIEGESYEGGSIALTLEAAERYRNVLRHDIAAEQRRFERLEADIAKACAKVGS